MAARVASSFVSDVIYIYIFFFSKTRPHGGDEEEAASLLPQQGWIIILFLTRIALTLDADEKCSGRPGLDVSYQKVPKVPSRLGPLSLSDDGMLPRLFRSVAAGLPLCLLKVDSQSGNTPAVVCAVFLISLFFS